MKKRNAILITVLVFITFYNPLIVHGNDMQQNQSDSSGMQMFGAGIGSILCTALGYSVVYKNCKTNPDAQCGMGGGFILLTMPVWSSSGAEVMTGNLDSNQYWGGVRWGYLGLLVGTVLGSAVIYPYLASGDHDQSARYALGISIIAQPLFTTLGTLSGFRKSKSSKSNNALLNINNTEFILSVPKPFVKIGAYDKIEGIICIDIVHVKF